ncbi:hypothetical protein Scep_030875 [Stephania cephalantha]|uniref:Uncharacterized protein n=1 Tax=Stephania cephalantha TaxID=152367 RepID=A0AAP0HEU1_9MAGN
MGQPGLPGLPVPPLHKPGQVIMCEIIIDNGSRSISRMFHRRRPIVEGARAPLTMDGCSP